MNLSWHHAKLITRLWLVSIAFLIFGSIAAASAYSQSVQLTNLSRGGTIFYAGDSLSVTISGPPNAPVTCTIDDWTGDMGLTDANGYYTFTTTAASQDVGEWTEYWTVNGAPATPYPLIFTIYETPPQTHPVVRLTNTTVSGSAYHPGDSFLLSITDGAPYATVTCTIGDWTGNIGTTDANGSYSFTGTMRDEDVGLWIQYWAVGGVAAQPYPLLFAVTSLHGVTTITDILFDPDRWIIAGFAYISRDYETGIYYQLATSTSILGNGAPVPLTYTQYGLNSAYVEAPANSGWQYQAVTETFMIITYSYTIYNVTYYWDPFDYYGEPHDYGYKIIAVVVDSVIQQTFTMVNIFFLEGAISQVIETPASCNLTITSQPDGWIYDLGGSYYNQASIPIAVSGDTCFGSPASWTFAYNYTSSSGQHTFPTTTRTTSTTVGQPSTYNVPPELGGKITISVSAHGGTATKTVYVDGPSGGIPDHIITNQLTSLYSGATPDLLAKIAVKESGYKQFTSKSLFNVAGHWPYESGDPGGDPGGEGAYVGLMQVPTNWANAFNWITNAASALTVFQSKQSLVASWVALQRNGHQNLPDLTPTQKEDDALVQYGPAWSAEHEHYYIPNSNYNGWIQNSNCIQGQDYVLNVRNSTIPNRN